MENSNNAVGNSGVDENPDAAAVGAEVSDAGSNPVQTRRTPFTNLNQVDADHALARTLQEQDDDDFDDPDDMEEYDGTDIDENDENDEDAFDVHAHADADVDNDINHGFDLDPAAFSSDESYARALQDAEEREMAARLLALAGINEREAEDAEDHGGHSQDTWEDVDPDELSYEELLALGEVVGTESRGLSADTIASLPSINYKSPSTQDGSTDSCVICRLDFEDGETLTVLSCKHSYHPDCINDWLQINKVCPICSTEVSAGNC
ncbi:Zinc finger, RING-type [Dillenia turbinata]|uniref:Zinc finger, RING-type n=1 Tax=Dillenia turbinata TaxID=194707 RepID=A0AAN8UYA9_9MAGN